MPSIVRRVSRLQCAATRSARSRSSVSKPACASSTRAAASAARVRSSATSLSSAPKMARVVGLSRARPPITSVRLVLSASMSISSTSSAAFGPAGGSRSAGSSGSASSPKRAKPGDRSPPIDDPKKMLRLLPPSNPDGCSDTRFCDDARRKLPKLLGLAIRQADEIAVSRWPFNGVLNFRGSVRPAKADSAPVSRARLSARWAAARLPRRFTCAGSLPVWRSHAACEPRVT